MKQSYVVSIEIEEEVSTVILNEEMSEREASQLKDGERVLVDSDDFAFLYIIEDEQGFRSIRFEPSVWAQLKEAYQAKTTFYVKLNEHTRFALTQFNEELDFLLENIRGNGNYGEAFEEAVNSIF